MRRYLLLVSIFFNSLSYSSQQSNTVHASIGVAGISVLGASWAAWNYTAAKARQEKLTNTPKSVTESDRSYAQAVMSKQLFAQKLIAARKCAAINERILEAHCKGLNIIGSDLLSQLKKHQTKLPALKNGIALYEDHTHACEVEEKNKKKEKHEICYSVYKAHEAVKEALNQNIVDLNEQVEQRKQSCSQLKSLKHASDAQKETAKAKRIEKNKKKCNDLKTAGCFFGATFLSALAYYFYSK